MNSELDKTKKLDDLSDIETELEKTVEIIPEEIAAKNSKKKNKKPNKIIKWWKSLTKKQHIIFITCGILILLLIVGLIVFLVLKFNKKEEEQPVEEKPVIVIDNYKYSDGTLTFMNDDKEDIGSYTCENKSEEECYVAYYSNEDTFDTIRKYYEDDSEIKIRSKIYLDKYVFIVDGTDETKINLYNMETNEIEDAFSVLKTYDAIKSDYVVLKNKDGKYGLYLFEDGKLNSVVSGDYTSMYIMDDTRIVVREANKSYIIDFNNKKLTKAISGEIMSYNSSYIASLNGTSYELYDYNGKKIINTAFDYIRLLDNYVALVTNGTLMIKDYEGNQMIGEAITLTNADYLIKYIYDSNGNKLEEKSAFTITQNDTNIQVTAYGTPNVTKIISIYEGALSKNHKYYSYFDGTLYFYSDEAKTTLIGKYVCSNNNAIKGADSTYKNCYIAYDNTSYRVNEMETKDYAATSVYDSKIPLFNNRFVYIVDTNNTAKVSVKLYDLKTNKALGSYNFVDTFSYNDTFEFFISSNRSTDVICQNKNNKFGIVTLTDSGATAKFNFDYDHIEKIGDYYLVKQNNKWKLIDESGVSKTVEFDGVIKAYNASYIKVMTTNNRYYIYSYSGVRNTTVTNEDGSKYLKMYNNFVAKVDEENRLTIVDYEGNSVINDTIQLFSNNYYNTGEGNNGLSFIIKENPNNTITISVFRDGDYSDFTYSLTTKSRV